MPRPRRAISTRRVGGGAGQVVGPLDVATPGKDRSAAARVGGLAGLRLVLPGGINQAGCRSRGRPLVFAAARRLVAGRQAGSSARANLRDRCAEVGHDGSAPPHGAGHLALAIGQAGARTPAQPAQRPIGGRTTPHIEGVVFFFCAGFLAVFFVVLLLFCAANAVPEPITAAAGSTTAAPKAPIMAAITSCFILSLHCQAS